jgi:hypothetical protein
MEYYDVVRQSIKAFMKGKTPTEMAALKEGGLKYTPDYFNEFEGKLIEEPKKGKKKSEPDDE